jgi:hypothetical protein
VEADVASVKQQVDSQQSLMEGLFMEAHKYPRLVLVVPDVDTPTTFTEIFGAAKEDVKKAASGVASQVLSGKKLSFNMLSSQKMSSFSPEKLLVQVFRVHTICEFTYQVITTEITLSQPKE